MAVCDLSEQVQIEAYALQLGWVLRRIRQTSRFTVDGQTIGVWWDDEGVATRAVITDAEDRVTARRESYAWQTATVGEWVRMMLSAIVTARPAGEVPA
jgi:hypothetical protein